MPSQHKHQPIPFRPTDEDRTWLMTYAKAVSRPVNAILREALAEYRKRREGSEEKG